MSKRSKEDKQERTPKPMEIHGNWDLGYSLDVHTLSSEYMGVDDWGHDRFDTVRSKLGKLIYELKYRNDISVIKNIVDIVTEICTFKDIDYIIPVPPSNTDRKYQPVIEIARELGKRIKVLVLETVVHKSRNTPELKNISDYSKRLKVLRDAFKIEKKGILKNKSVLLIDDLYRSGATMTCLTSLLKMEGNAKSVKVLALTRTRKRG